MTFAASWKPAGVEPSAWFRDVLARVPDHPVTRLADILPHNGKPVEPSVQPEADTCPDGTAVPCRPQRLGIDSPPTLPGSPAEPPKVEGFTGSLRSARAFLKIENSPEKPYPKRRQTHPGRNHTPQARSIPPRLPPASHPVHVGCHVPTSQSNEISCPTRNPLKKSGIHPVPPAKICPARPTQ
jgi:hypothetical protein